MSAHSVRKPWWQQATALVTVSTGGVITGFTFVPGAATTITSPTSMPLHLLALQKAASSPASSDDSALRSAIVNVAGYYLRLAQTRTPAQMEALIWGKDSLNGADHGPSCAAFASLTLELAAQAVGKQSWVTGGTTYPWPLHEWADVRVDPNPDSLGITSIVQDAEAHQRWHPLGDGYRPQPGDWVLFTGHVEVVTSYANGVLDTIGGDSLPNFTVNAHSFPGPLADQGVAGFVDNGHLSAGPPTTAGQSAVTTPAATARPGAPAHAPGQARRGSSTARHTGRAGLANIPGAVAAIPAATPATAESGAPAIGTAAIPGATQATADSPASGTRGEAGGASSGHYQKHTASDPAQVPGTRAQQAFINQIAPGAIAAQQRWGVPTSVTIAQAIEESGWGQSQLAAQYHNLFGIKGTGPAGSVEMPTSEYSNGQWVTIDAAFRVYHNTAESIADHAELLATSGYYTRAMADRAVPDAFANDLTGIYATDPEYGANLIALMRLYDLYRFDAPAAQAPAPAAGHAPAVSPAAAAHAPTTGVHAPTTGVHAPAPAAPGSAAIPGSAAVQWSAPHPGNSAGYAPAPGGAGVPGTASLPGTAPVPGGTPVPGSAAVPGITSVPGTASVPGTSVPDTTPVPGSTPVPGTTPVPRGTPVPGSATVLGSASIPGTAAFPGSVRAPGNPATAHGTAAVRRQAANRGSASARGSAADRGSAARPQAARATTRLGSWGSARIPGLVQPAAPRYQPELPAAVATAFFTSAKTPLARAQPLYRDVAGQAGIRWELLAACDWMQCQAHPRFSPVHGEKIGMPNPDGTVYATKSAALAQCASDLAGLAAAVYGIDLTAPRPLSVRALADTFAAFRWGALLRRHGVSAMEFPYSVAGLTPDHLKMHWPAISDPAAPDKPGGRFRLPFGAVPVVLSLNYPATV